MNQRTILVAGIALLTTIAATLFHGDGAVVPTRDECRQFSGCAECHQDELPPSHTQSFLSDRHGETAYAQPTSCTGCHEQAQCDDCHAEKVPIWHTGGIGYPQLDVESRRAHSAIGQLRAQDCLTCHEQNFRSQCSACHKLTEFKR